MKVVVHPIAEKYLDKLNTVDRDRIENALLNLEKEPPEGDIRPYVGKKGVMG
jgi:mRNA-degrading endonuclease RelE of RelBE toxin-antitoxin system